MIEVVHRRNEPYILRSEDFDLLKDSDVPEVIKFFVDKIPGPSSRRLLLQKKAHDQTVQMHVFVSRTCHRAQLH